MIVGSGNPVKRLAVADALAAWGRPADVTGVDVASGVAAQPWGDDETLRGATARATAARTLEPAAGLWVGVEGGVCEAVGDDGGLDAMAWVVALSPAGRGVARTATFRLPPAVVALLREGVELGDADDRMFGHTGHKRAGGTVATLTNGAITRRAYYAHAATLALVSLFGSAFR